MVLRILKYHFKKLNAGGDTATAGLRLLQSAVAAMRLRDEIPTPALLLDLDAFESNVATMAAYIRERGRAFRPHGKTHKCPEIARRLIDAGAVGVGAARLSEAEVFAAHGIPGVLVT